MLFNKFKAEIKRKDKTYTIIYNRFLTHYLLVNDKKIKLKKNIFTSFFGLEQKIKLGDDEVIFVIVGNNYDLVVDGVYYQTKEAYTPLRKPALFTYLFVLTNILISFITSILDVDNYTKLGGALIALFLIYFTFATSANSKLTRKKIVNTIVISHLLLWGLFYFFKLR